jgi:pimeloyl-ACP methyl ester carboxylesterase
MTNVRRFELRVDVSGAVPWAASELAVTLVVPARGIDGPRTLALAFPGGGYSRGYWDIQWPGGEGYSEAEYHAQRGWIVACIDHLGVGDSSQPDPASLTFELLAAANAAASRAVVDGLRAGTLVDALGKIDVARAIGVGQSMGGCLTIVAQALHEPFDAIAVLGFSGIHTVLPSPDGGIEVAHVERGRADEEAMISSSAELMARDVFAWAFHYDDTDPLLLEADLGGNYPLRVGTPPPWGSATVPPAAMSMLSPGVVAEEAAAIEVPVFVGVGERDVCPDPWIEPTAYRGSRYVTLAVVGRMAHMHNFASSREELWHRLHAWADTI